MSLPHFKDTYTAKLERIQYQETHINFLLLLSMLYRNYKTSGLGPYLGLCNISLLKAPQELTDSITTSLSCSNYSPGSTAHILSSHNYSDTLYELLKDTVHWNIAQDTPTSLNRDKTW